MVTSELNGPRCQERYKKQNQNKADRKAGASPVVALRAVRGNKNTTMKHLSAMFNIDSDSDHNIDINTW